MTTQDSINYNRIAEAIDYIKHNFKGQPGLDEVAEKIHLSPFHFQRLFTEWAGVSPKKFLQYLSVEYAKNILKERQASELAGLCPRLKKIELKHNIIDDNTLLALIKNQKLSSTKNPRYTNN